MYSGQEEENAPHTREIALTLSKGARNAVIGWERNVLTGSKERE